MGKLDSVTKLYLSNNAVFADIFNFYLYNGKQVIKPEQLRPMDITEISVIIKNKKSDIIQKYRDILKTWLITEDDSTV